jgi:tetratricopeptide (TPR) repeat protein
MRTIEGTLPRLVWLILVACGPKVPVDGPDDAPTPDASSASQAPGGLPEGKSAASYIPTPPGVLVTRLDEEQLQMIYEEQGPFCPAARLDKAMESSATGFRQVPIGAGPSNFHDLFDGIREPDPFLVASGQDDVHVGKMYAADPSILADVQALMTKIDEDPAGPAGYCEQWEALVERDPKMPLLHDQLAGCYQAAGKLDKAVEALKEEIIVNPSHSGALLGVAAATVGPGTQEDAREKIILALMYYPAFAEARDWINSTGALAKTTARMQYFAPRLSITVDDEGWVVVASPENQPWVGQYATCKAGFRYAPEVRMAFGMKSGAYKPSLLEEMVCLRLAADGYEKGRANGNPQEVMGEILARAVSEKRLLAAAFFEVIGYHDPDLMKLLPEELAAQVMTWIEDTVLIETGDSSP